VFELKHRPDESDDSPPKSTDESPSLNCMRGLSGPDGLRDDMHALLALPAPIRQKFWMVLAPYLAGDTSEEAQRPIFDLCEEHGTDPQSLVGPVRGARFLVSQGARAALDEQRFVEDLSQLTDSSSLQALIEVMLPCFERAAPIFRKEIVARTIADHGRLVRDVNWRVDKIINSEHGDGVNVPVAVLTFRYQEGAREERITLHLLPEQLAKVRTACLDMLPAEPPTTAGSPKERSS